MLEIGAMIAITNVLVATDFSACSATALTYARVLARAFGARLHVLHVVERTLSDGTNAIGYVGLIPELQTALEDAEQAQLEALVSDDDRRTLHAVTSLRTLDTPAHAIVEYAETSGVDLIVIGTHGRHGLVHMVMGSVAEQVARTSPCPVLTVKVRERQFVTQDSDVRPTASA
jgi:nucleotide-binding universal stress UspA family protein